MGSLGISLDSQASFLAHELGHNIANLKDEYPALPKCDYTSASGTGITDYNIYQASSTTNNINSCKLYSGWGYLADSCYSSGGLYFGNCPSLNNKISCYKGGKYCDSSSSPYFWRPASKTIMYGSSSGATDFSLVDITYFCRELEKYTGVRLGICNNICIDGCAQKEFCKDPDANGVGACINDFQVKIGDVINAGHSVANSMEGTRKIPSTIVVGTQTLTPAQYLSLASTSIKRIIEDSSATINTLVDVPFPITEPLNQYPAANLRSPENKVLYSEPLTIEGYHQIINAIQLSIGASASEIISYNGGQIRYPEAIYFVSHILRFHKFFDSLPKSQSLFIISPKGLVPWEVPAGYESYTDVTDNYENLAPDFLHYYSYNPHYYDVYYLAREIVGGERSLSCWRAYL